MLIGVSWSCLARACCFCIALLVIMFSRSSVAWELAPSCVVPSSESCRLLMQSLSRSSVIREMAPSCLFCLSSSHCMQSFSRLSVAWELAQSCVVPCTVCCRHLIVCNLFLDVVLLESWPLDACVTHVQCPLGHVSKKQTGSCCYGHFLQDFSHKVNHLVPNVFWSSCTVALTR